MDYWIGSLKLTNGIRSDESRYTQILSRDSSNKPSAGVFAARLVWTESIRTWMHRVCVFVQRDSLNIKSGLFVCLTQWWSHKWRVWGRWQVRKHTYAYRHIIRRSRDSGALSRRAFMSVHLCEDCGKLAVCVCVCCTWCWDSSRLPLAHSESPRRCRILASSSRRPSCSARRRPETQRNRDLHTHTLQELLYMNSLSLLIPTPWKIVLFFF